MGSVERMKVLVLTAETISADDLRGALGPQSDPSATEVLIVAPALQASGLKFWVSDADEAIARADQVQRESVAAVDGDGVSATGDTGESDPMLAIEDALQTFPADRIVLVESKGDAHHRGEISADDVAARFGLPVSRA